MAFYSISGKLRRRLVQNGRFFIYFILCKIGPAWLCLQDILVCWKIHTDKATLVILGDIVLKSELLEIYHNSLVGGYLGLYCMVH